MLFRLRPNGAVTLVSLMAAMLTVVHFAYGQCTFDWQRGNPIVGVDAAVKDMTLWQTDVDGMTSELLVVGGGFTVAGDIIASNIAAWDGAKWHSFDDGLSGGVLALTVYQGDLIAGGLFTYAGETVVNNIARWDGESWHPLGDGVDASVRTLTVFNGELIAGGYFQSADGKEIRGIARWDGESWKPVGNGLDGTCPSCLVPVRALKVHDGSLYVGGLFGGADGIASQGIIRWNGEQWHGLDGGVNAGLQAIGVHNGDIIIGGNFVSAGNTPATGIARWDGSTWHALGQGVSGPNPVVFTLEVFEDVLFVGGMFSSVPEVPNAGYIAQWNGTEWNSVGGGLVGRVSTLLAQKKFLYAGGEFASHLRRWEGNEWKTIIVPGANHDHPTQLVALEAYEGDVIGARTGYIARWNGNVWEELGEGVNSHVLDMTLHEGDLIAAGAFTMAGGYPTNYIARWDGENWHRMGESWTYWVRSLAVYEGDIIGAGSSFIRRWAGTAWRQLGHGTTGSPNGNVNAMIVYNDDLIVAGAFSSIDGQSRLRIARWDGSSWHSLCAGIGPPGFPSFEVLALAEYSGELYAAGRFSTAGGKPVANIARWDGENWHPVGTGITYDNLGRVAALQVYNGELIAAGRFSSAGGVPVKNIARWDGDQWHAVSGGLAGADFTLVRDLVAWNGDLVAGGLFSVAGDFISQAIARWGPARDCLADITPSCGDGKVDVYDLLALLEAWGPCVNCIADLNSDGTVDLHDLVTLLQSWGPCP